MNFEFQSQTNFTIIEVFKKVIGSIFHCAKYDSFTRCAVTEFVVLFLFEKTGLIGDRFTVRIEFGKVEHLIHPFKEYGNLHMFQLFGHLMHLLPSKAHFFNEEHLRKTMLPDNQESFFSSLRCKM